MLPGHEQVRNARLDSLCEDIGASRDALSVARANEAEAISGAMQEMERKQLTVYRHAGVEIVLVPGAAKLRVRMTKETGDGEVETGARRGSNAGAHDEEPAETDESGDE